MSRPRTLVLPSYLADDASQRRPKHLPRCHAQPPHLLMQQSTNADFRERHAPLSHAVGPAVDDCLP